MTTPCNELVRDDWFALRRASDVAPGERVHALAAGCEHARGAQAVRSGRGW